MPHDSELVFWVLMLGATVPFWGLLLVEFWTRYVRPLFQARPAIAPPKTEEVTAEGRAERELAETVERLVEIINPPTEFDLAEARKAQAEKSKAGHKR